MSITERFAAKWVIWPPTGCHLWMGSTAGYGYGRFRSQSGRTVPAHRFAWELQHGPVPEGLCVLHRCDTPRCVNPDHLFLGTHAENMADMVKKNRQRGASGDRNGARLHRERMPRGDANGARRHPERLPRGEQNGNSRLTAEVVLEMRRLYATGGYSFRDLARKYGVSKSPARHAIIGQTWAHLTEDGVR